MNTRKLIWVKTIHRVINDTKSHDCYMFTLRSGKHIKAEEFLRSVYNSQTELLSHYHRDTLTTRYYLGINLKHQGKLEEARLIFHEAYEQSKVHLGEHHPLTLHIRSEYLVLSIILPTFANFNL